MRGREHLTSRSITIAKTLPINFVYVLIPLFVESGIMIRNVRFVHRSTCNWVMFDFMFDGGYELETTLIRGKHIGFFLT